MFSAISYDNSTLVFVLFLFAKHSVSGGGDPVIRPPILYSQKVLHSLKVSVGEGSSGRGGYSRRVEMEIFTQTHD